MTMGAFLLSAVTDSRLLPQGVHILDRVRMLCSLGVGRIVLREKGMPDDEFEPIAEEFVSVCRGSGVIPVIAHRTAIAERVGADAVQISVQEIQDDPDVTRRFRRVGVSVHSVDEALIAERCGASSVTAGHVFPTVCKKGVPQRGIGFLKDVVNAVSIPVFAIGGIDTDVIAQVHKTGATGACMMSVMMSSSEDHISKLAQMCQKLNRPVFDRNVLYLYAVTDSQWLRPGESLASRVQAAILGGATAIQIREKHISRYAFIDEARDCLRICRSYGIPLIVNDDVSVATEIGADGVHLGQDDMPASKAKQIFNGFIGVSASTVEEARKAKEDGADYIGCGAVFPTATKNDADDLGIMGLRKISEAVDIPIVAIGGISKDNIRDLEGTGIDGIAVVSAIFKPEDTEAAARELRKTLDLVTF